MTIDLFITCLNDALFPRTGMATVRVLERLGHHVTFNPAQTCCGQMHLNSGYRKEAISIVRYFVDVFEPSETVVSPSGSCVAMVRDLYPRVAEWAEDAALHDRVINLGRKFFELSEFLVGQLGITDVGAYFPHTVTYHPTCHAARVLRVGEAPLRLLRDVEGLTLVELPDAEQCCGFGGTFSIKNAETSTAMLTDKVSNVSNSGADYCAAGDNSCLMHIGGGLTRTGERARAIHLAEILASTREESFA